MRIYNFMLGLKTRLRRDIRDSAITVEPFWDHGVAKVSVRIDWSKPMQGGMFELIRVADVLQRPGDEVAFYSDLIRHLYENYMRQITPRVGAEVTHPDGHTEWIDLSAFDRLSETTNTNAPASEPPPNTAEIMLAEMAKLKAEIGEPQQWYDPFTFKPRHLKP